MQFLLVISIILFLVILFTKNKNSVSIFNLFTIRKEYLVNDIVELTILLILIIAIPLTVYIAQITAEHNYYNSCNKALGSGGRYAIIEFKKELAELNFINSEGKVNASNCPGCKENKAALAKFFAQYVFVSACGNYSDTYTYEDQRYNKRPVVKCNENNEPIKKNFWDSLLGKKDILPVTNNPYFIKTTQLHKVMYEIIKADGVCGTVDTLDPDKANCVILVDINGNYPPNEESTGNENQPYVFKDRFKLIIMADKVLPAVSKTNDAAKKALE